MNNVSLTGDDVIQIDGRTLTDLADGDCVHITFPNDAANVKVGKNGNMIYAFNEMGKLTSISIRVLVGSSDQKFLNSRFQEMKQGFSSFILLKGYFSKQVGKGDGSKNTVVYIMDGGVFKKNPEAKMNVEGDTEQSVAVYEILFGNGDVVIQ